MPDRERLPHAAEDDFLVRDEAGGDNGVDGGFGAPCVQRSPSQCRMARLASAVQWSSIFSARGNTGTFSANRIVDTAP